MSRILVKALLWCAAVCALIGIGIIVLPGSKKGDIDPLGSLLSLTALVLAMPALALALWDKHRQETDTTETTIRLARAVVRHQMAVRNNLLGRRSIYIDVEFSPRPAPGHHSTHPQSGLLSEVDDFFENLPRRRLLITGEPGAGKTLAAIQLTIKLTQAVLDAELTMEGYSERLISGAKLS